MSSEYIGSGLAFPMRTDATGSLALVSGNDEIEESMRLILGTAFGERPMRPEYGCGIHDLLFAPADSSLAGLMAYEVRASLRRWEPRIDVDDVEVTFDQDRATAYIQIAFNISDKNDPRNLVFPFYFIPGEEA